MYTYNNYIKTYARKHYMKSQFWVIITGWVRKGHLFKYLKISQKCSSAVGFYQRLSKEGERYQSCLLSLWLWYFNWKTCSRNASHNPTLLCFPLTFYSHVSQQRSKFLFLFSSTIIVLKDALWIILSGSDDQWYRWLNKGAFFCCTF